MIIENPDGSIAGVGPLSSKPGRMPGGLADRWANFWDVALALGRFGGRVGCGRKQETNRQAMRSLYTAIIHLREPTPAEAEESIGAKLRLMGGVDQVVFDRLESLITLPYYY
jgi:hypothetical protein